MVEDGRVYAALSPFYHINKGKKNWDYFIDKDAFLSYVQEQFLKSNEIFDGKTNKKLTKSQVHTLIMSTNDYKDIMDRIADTYAIYPVLLEDILKWRMLDFKKFKKNIEAKYRFVTVTERQKTRIIDGLVNEKSHTVILNDTLLNACAPLLIYTDNYPYGYRVNGALMGLYELLKLFRDSEPKNIERSKGIGSMDAREIGITTLDPKNRTLLRYTCEDINQEIEEMRRVNDDKFSLIKDVDISKYNF